MKTSRFALQSFPLPGHGRLLRRPDGVILLRHRRTARGTVIDLRRYESLSQLGARLLLGSAFS